LRRTTQYIFIFPLAKWLLVNWLVFTVHCPLLQTLRILGMP
jgi:hypothetical protein